MAKYVSRSFQVDVVKIKFYDSELDTIVSGVMEVPEGNGKEKVWEKFFIKNYSDGDKLVYTELMESKAVTAKMLRDEFYVNAVKVTGSKESEE